MLQLDLFEHGKAIQRPGHPFAEKFSQTPVEPSIQEAPQRLCSTANEMITSARFAGNPTRLIVLAQWRCPCCRAVHHYWPAKSDCQRCHNVVEFVPANQAAQTIVNWVNQ